MQSDQNWHSIHETLSELRTIFLWGEKAVPFLEEMMQFIESLTPIIDEINVSLNESAKRFPSAESQLNDVTKATELATNEILSLLETSLSDCDTIDKENKLNQKAVANFSDFKSSLRTDIRAALSDSDPRVHVLHAKLWHQTDKLETQLNSSCESNAKIVKSLRSSLNKIFMSLQVQDITTQQISAVNNVIQSVQTQLSELHSRISNIKKIETPAFSLEESRLSMEDATLEPTNKASAPVTPAVAASDEGVIPLESGQTFDAKASYDKRKSRERQKDADEMIEQFTSSPGAISEPVSTNTETIESSSIADSNSGFNESDGPASDTDIDELFNSAGGSASNNDIDKLFESESDSASNDDIDKLFESDGGSASNDDIDKLFGA